jgi:hypothetical protein
MSPKSLPGAPGASVCAEAAEKRKIVHRYAQTDADIFFDKDIFTVTSKRQKEMQERSAASLRLGSQL